MLSMNERIITEQNCADANSNMYVHVIIPAYSRIRDEQIKGEELT